MQSIQTPAIKPAARVKFLAAVSGASALAVMGVFAVQTNESTTANAAGSKGGPMQTGVTTSLTVAPLSLTISQAKPTVKAKPHWGQPAEP
jgi:hypothetical protein